jgi:NAD(P)-dependent dehydrogenase (short-subunit alcohol dehydrogenase family)
MELKHFGIHVAIVEPGAMETEIFAKSERLAEQDLASATAAVQELYRPAMTAAKEALGAIEPSPADVAVDAIVKALTGRTPAARYLAGSDARMLNMLRHLPDRLRDRMLMRNLGLEEERFEQPQVAPAAFQLAGR